MVWRLPRESSVNSPSMTKIHAKKKHFISNQIPLLKRIKINTDKLPTANMARQTTHVKLRSVRGQSQFRVGGPNHTSIRTNRLLPWNTLALIHPIFPGANAGTCQSILLKSQPTCGRKRERDREESQQRPKTQYHLGKIWVQVGQDWFSEEIILHTWGRKSCSGSG